MERTCSPIRRRKSIAEPAARSPVDARPKTKKKRITGLDHARENDAGTPKPRASLVKQAMIGRWRLTRMSAWDNDFMDEESPAFIEFAKDGGGEFHFGYVHCGIDWTPEPRQGRPGVAFTFDGHDEMHPTQGRGWAAQQIDGTLHGHLHFHQSDDSAFWASRQRPRDTPLT